MLAVPLSFILFAATPEGGPATPIAPPSVAVPIISQVEPTLPPAVPAASKPDVPAAPVAAQTSPLEPAKPDPDGSEIVVTARVASPADPIAAVNVVAFDALQVTDRLFVAPVAHGYKQALPDEARDGVTNLLNNLDEPIVFVNFVLQGKPKLALRTVARFAINSTIGIAGLIDVAKRKPFNMPRRSNGLADTLGYYGVKTGPFLFLPLIGPTTVRDVIGRVFDLSLVPFAVGGITKNPIYSLSKGTLSAIDDRVHADDEGREERFSSMDPYVATREHYLETRVKEIRVLRAEPGLRPRLRKTDTPSP